MRRAWVLFIICLSFAVSWYPMFTMARAASKVWELLYACPDQTASSSVRAADAEQA